MTTATDSPALNAAPEGAATDQQRPLSHPWALLALLAGTAALYLWNLSVSGWANSFYSAAAQAGSHSWKAFLFGSSDAANSITVDKPPLALWPMALSVRVFGLNAWSILVPQAVIGVASVALLWDTVRRRFGEIAALTAGLVLALTPIAVAIFRYNNPDALLLLLMIAAVWATLRAVDDGRTRWLLMAGVCVGLGYLTKQLQVLLILPALGVTYLFAGPPQWVTRLWQLALGLVAAVVGAGWWVLIVQLWPANDRPWIGGTTHNSIMELTLGYNGFGRLSGDEPGSTAGLALGPDNGPNQTAASLHLWGVPGITRLFQLAQAGQIVWLLPAALIFGVVLLGWRGRAPRTDAKRAQLMIWGLWLVCTGLVFSYMQGIFHPYYTVALAPAIAALVGIGIVVCWQCRRQAWGRVTLAATVVATAATAYVAMNYYPLYFPWLKWLVLGIAVVVLIWLAVAHAAWSDRAPVRVGVAAAIALMALLAPTAYSVTTVIQGNSGGLPSAGPTLRARTRVNTASRLPGVPVAQLTEVSGPGFLRPIGAPGRPSHVPGCSLLDSGTPAPEVIAKLTFNADHYRWVAATVGSMCAAGYQLDSGHPVMPVGGYNSTDPAPAPDEFLRLTLSKQIHYFIITNPVQQDKWGHLNDAALIQQWVQLNFTPIRVGRVLMYDLTQ
jgi:4-amino-4-deoxy-L-arabinose transferase-like glycosyltransferase